MRDPYELMREAGRNLVEEAIKARTSGNIAASPIGSRILRDGTGLVLKRVKEWVEELKKPARGNRSSQRRLLQLLDDVGLESAVGIAMRVVVSQACSVHSSRRTKIVGALSSALTTEATWRRFRETDTVGYTYSVGDLSQETGRQRALRTRKVANRLEENGESLDWDAKDRSLISSSLVHWVVKYSGLFIEGKVKKGRDKYDVVISPTDHLIEWIRSGEAAMGDLCHYLPLNQPPTGWGPGVAGGYDADEVPATPFISGRPKNRVRKPSGEMPTVYTAINALQDTAWQINPAVRSALSHVFDKGWSGYGLHTNPGEPPAWMGDEHKVEYAQQKRAWWHNRARWSSSSLKVQRALWLAGEYGDSPMHFVHSYDYRGRVYPLGSSIGYQREDSVRAMLRFASAEEIGDGMDWFLVAGANLFGVDKVSLEDRIAWVRTNSEELIKVGQDPIRNKMWGEADKPFQALAWCDEYARMQHQGETFRSQIPIGMDGSNNGLQIYSILLRDPVGGLATNCCPAAVPADVYQQVADVATAKLRELAKTGKDAKHRRWARRVLEFCGMLGLEGLPRSATKKPTMTLPYGSTLYACQSSLVSWYHDFVRGKHLPTDARPFPEKDAYQAMNWLGGVVWDSLEEVVTKAVEAMRWLREASDIVSQSNSDIAWTSPTGFRCRHRFRKSKHKRHLLAAGRDSIWYNTYSEEGQPIDAKKSRNAFAPNYVHSLDASAMMLTTSLMKAQGANDFRMIHDDYGTHAKYSRALADTLRYAFVDIFRHDLLSILHQELSSLTEEEIPQPPSRGSLDLQGLLDSKYFFA